jgi:tetratricopeptide (TPR) repeat protein
LTLFGHYATVRDNSVIESQLGDAYMQDGNNQEALVHFEKSLKTFPYDETFAETALAYNNMGNKAKASDFYLQAYNANNYVPLKHSDQLYTTMARFFLMQKDYSQAKNILQDATVDYPDQSYFWALLALDKYQLKDKVGAIAAAEKAVTLSNNTFNTALLFNLISNKPFTLYLQ